MLESLNTNSPKTLEQKRLEGFPGKKGDCEKDAAEVSVQLPVVGAPFEDMSDEAKNQWKVLAWEWEVLLKETDREFLRLYCETWDELRKARLMIQVEGAVMVGTKGGLVQNPWCRIAADKETKMIQMLDKIGATPTARARVLTADAKNGILGKPREKKGFRNSGFLQ